MQSPSLKLSKAHWAILAVLTLICVFILPFYFPPTGPPVRSPAYAAGFNNRIAEISAGLLSLLAAILHLRSATPTQPAAAAPIPRRWLLISAAVIAAWTTLLGAAMIRAQVYFGEALYFLVQTEKVLRQHLTLYRDVQFAYGPLLLGWPALWMRLLGASGPAELRAYVVALATLQAAGIALCFYVVDALPLSRSLKLFALAFLTLGSLSPTLGLNYSIFRFIVPFAFAVLLARQSRLALAAFLSFCGVVFGFLVSGEIGVACFAAAFTLGLYRASNARVPYLTQSHRVRWELSAAAALLGTAAAFLLLGPAYFLTLTRAGGGAFDLILTPEPRTLVLLVAVIFLAPLAVARAIRTRAQPQASLLIAFYAATLALLPVALGRADSGHEFFFTLGAILISLVAIDAAPRTRRTLWLAALVAFVLLHQAAAIHLYLPSLRLLARQAAHPPATDAFDVPALQRQLAGHPVTIVDSVPWRVDQLLLRDHLIQPAFFCEASGVWSADAEQRKIADMRRGDFALAPAEGMADRDDFNQSSIHRWRALGLHYRELRTPFIPGRLTDAELRANWQPVAAFGGNTLYRKLR